MAIDPEKEAQRRANISKTQKANYANLRMQQAEKELINKEVLENFVSFAKQVDVSRSQFLSISPDTIRTVLDSTIGGLLFYWADFCDWMMDTDDNIRICIEHRTKQITLDKLVIEPASNDPIDKEVAQFLRDQIAKIPEFDKTLRHLLRGVFYGASVSEILWKRNYLSNTFDIKEILPIPLRRIKIRNNPTDNEGNPVITPATTGYGRWIYSYYNLGDNGYGEGVDVFDLFLGKFIVHSPGDEPLPHYRGLLRAAAETYFYKKVGIANYAAALERIASPALTVFLNPKSPEISYINAANAASKLQSGTVAVFPSDSRVEPVPISNPGGDNMWRNYIDLWNERQTILILGGNLITNIGDKGSYNAQEGQSDRLNDMIYADAYALAETLTKQIFEYIITYNAHLWGFIPKMPKARFDFSRKEPTNLAPYIIQTGKITNNEMRRSVGLGPLSIEQGGDDWAKIGTGMEDGQILTGANAHLNPPTPEENKPTEQDQSVTQTDIPIALTIRHEGSKWNVYSQKGKLLGSYDTEDEAKERLKQIEIHKNESLIGGGNTVDASTNYGTIKKNE